MPLFERLSKGLTFTPAGRGYHARVASAFEELRAATETLRPEPGKVVVSVTPTFASKWLIPNLPDFSAAHPDIDLRILATERVSSFHSDGIDLAVRQGSPPFGAALEAVRLFRQEIIAVAAPSFIVEYGLPMDVETLSRLPKLHDAHDLWPAFLKDLKLEDFAGHGIRLSQTALTIDAALSGQGVALVSRFLVRNDIAAKRLLQITPKSFSGKLDFYLLAKRGAKLDASAKTVSDWLINAAEAR
jgi:LysR family glycine cleavage system transcriptional activator